MSQPVVLDTTVLYNFGKAGRDDLVCRPWGDAPRAAEAALSEYEVGVTLGIHPMTTWASLRVEVLAMDAASQTSSTVPHVDTWAIPGRY